MIIFFHISHTLKGVAFFIYICAMETNVQEYLSYVFDRLNTKYESVMTKLWLNDRLLTLTCFHEEKFYDFTLLSEDGLSKEDFCKSIEQIMDELIGK